MRRILLAFAILLASFHAEAKQAPLTADEYCLALNLYYEARSEPVMGLLAVAYVTHNRMVQRKQTMCHVVFAYKQFSWVHQYHVLDENKHLKAEFRPKAKDRYWIICKILARTVMQHPEMDFTGGAEYFVAHYIYPRCLNKACSWLAKMEFVGRFGSHLFYREAKYTRTGVGNEKDFREGILSDCSCSLLLADRYCGRCLSIGFSARRGPAADH